MNRIFEESGIKFDFSSCGITQKFDTNTYSGLKAVDFISETDDCLYFIEVKNYQHPQAPLENKEKDYQMLIDAGTTSDTSVFNLEMGAKIKDSLLRQYASGCNFNKKVIYLLVIHLTKLGEFERGMLKTKILGHVPIGLNDTTFCKFKEISFEVTDIAQLGQYGIACTEI
ncbi:MAG: hypothetical protein LBN23_03365 [Paludibacter sp.]|jgi:hypothetical protein|nr:hypothetical protein [Paludibacter sp.]